MARYKFLFLLFLPWLVGCSEQGASYEINGRNHALSLIRITGFPWEKTAQYQIVPTRMPDCMRRHSLPKGPLNARFELFSPGDNAWIIRQRNRMFVMETRTCEGFAPLDKVPDTGLGTLVGTFEVRDNILVFTPAPPVAAPTPPPAG